jgi:hypothetical protein
MRASSPCFPRLCGETVAVAGRLLGFSPPIAFNTHRRAVPGLFPNSTARKIALADIEAHPRRNGRPISLYELVRAEREQDYEGARYQHYNETRRAGAERKAAR